MALFIEKARNVHGYRFYDAAVIAGYVQGDKIVVAAPHEFARSSPTVDKDGFQEVSKEAGPARIPDASERQNDCIAWRDSIIRKYSSAKPGLDVKAVMSGINIAMGWK